jgi:hypothetical protein
MAIMIVFELLVSADLHKRCNLCKMVHIRKYTKVVLWIMN